MKLHVSTYEQISLNRLIYIVLCKLARLLLYSLHSRNDPAYLKGNRHDHFFTHSNCFCICRSILRIHHNRHERRTSNLTRRFACCLNQHTASHIQLTQGNKKMARLVMDKANKKILGVCAGLANWSGIDPLIVRLLFVITTLIGVGSPIIIYILLAMILD